MVADVEVAVTSLLELDRRRSTHLRLLDDLLRQLLALSKHLDSLIIVENVARAFPQYSEDSLLHLLLLPPLFELGLSELLLKHIKLLILLQ